MSVAPIKRADLFHKHEFANGSWAAELQKELARYHRLAASGKRPGIRPAIIPGWKPKTRVWRGDPPYTRWVQYQPKDVAAFFWSGKPGVVSSATSLYAGYYVERGRPDGAGYAKEEVMSSAWHWNGFTRVISEGPFVARLNPILAGLPESRRCIWVLKWPDPAAVTKLGRDFAVEDLSGLKTYLDPASIAPNQWVDVILGVRYTENECLSLQSQIVEQILRALKQAYDLYSLVSEGLPR